MEKVFESNYQYIVHHPNISALETFFKPESEAVYGEYFQEEMEHLISFCERYKPSQLVINNVSGAFSIEPEIQEWMHQHFYPKLAQVGVIRKAYIVSEDFITKLSVEQTATEDPNPLFEYKFFSNVEEGKEWLAEKLTS